MADAVPQQQYAVPAAVAPVKQAEEQYIQQTPVWVVVVRGVQVVISIIILGMAGWLIHGYLADAQAFAIACAVFTWIVVAYVLVSEKVPSAHSAYNIWAVLSLDLLMAIFWLASLGANAAWRAKFTSPVTIEGCSDDGSAVDAISCTVSRRALDKRVAVAGNGALAMMSAIAGLSALLWLLFVATLVFHGHTFRLWHQEHKKPSADNATVEMKAQGTPMLALQPEAQPVHPQYSDQQQYQSQVYPPQAQPQQGAYPPQQTAAAYPTQQQPPAYPPQQQELPGGVQPQQSYAAYPDPAQYAQSQQTYSPHGTPAPGQPYYPPQQQQQQQQPYSPHGTPAPGQPYYPPQEKQ